MKIKIEHLWCNGMIALDYEKFSATHIFLFVQCEWLGASTADLSWSIYGARDGAHYFVSVSILYLLLSM